MKISENSDGQKMYQLAKMIFPICRSITGEGVCKTLQILKKEIPIKIRKVPSGTRAFDWTVPEEWNIQDAYILDGAGKKIVDFQKNNLHVVGYSEPVDRKLSLEQLQQHLHSLPQQPNAIPYVTSYYKKRWGFCITHRQRQRLKSGFYHVVIKSHLKRGNLTYGELLVKGSLKKEIFLSTYICHPSLANNEISGPVVTTQLAKWILSRKRRYSYRIIFIPETIGSIVYLSRHLKSMKKNIIAGFNITCVGDNRSYSYLASRYGNTFTDRVALKVLKDEVRNFKIYPFLKRGSDERQYCSPGVDLPVVTMMRTKFGEYPEYHTSLDNLDLISPQGLAGAYNVLRNCLGLIERNAVYQCVYPCEPQLGKRGMYPTLSIKNSYDSVENLMNFLTYTDGRNDLIDISNRTHIPVRDIYNIVDKLLDNKLIREVKWEVF